MGRLHGYGLELESLPGDWPGIDASPVVRQRLRWHAEPGLPAGSSSVWTRSDGSSLLIGWDGYAEYLVRSGSDAAIEARLGPIAESEAALGMVISVLPLCLPLFGLEPFHGAAVGLDDGALLVLGRAGDGKSTTAHALGARGLPLLADDACALDDDGLLWPGPPVYAPRVWEGEASAFGVYDGKTVLVAERHAAAPVPAASSVVLEPAPGRDLGVETVARADALRAVLEQVRAPWCMPELRTARQMRCAAALASRPVGRVRFDHAVHAPGAVADAIETWARSS